MTAPLILETEEGQQDELAFLGAGFLGSVYRSTKFPTCYRILPIQKAPINKRNAVREWIQRPRKRSVAPIVAAGQALVDGQAAFYIRYEIDARLTWAELLKDPRADTYTKLAYANLVLQEFSTWRNLLHDDPQQFLLPTPHDIILLDDMPHLLATPYWGHPDMETVFTHPAQSLYLAPELVRGSEGNIWGRNLDLYALGSTLFQSLFEITEVEKPEALLTRIAAGNLFAAPYCVRKYSFWMEKTDTFQDLLSDIKRMIHPNIRIRSGVDPQQLAANIAKYVNQLDPIAAVLRLLSEKKPREAFALLQDILLEQTSNELLLLSADIAGEYLARPTEAIDTLEQIIQKDAGNAPAYAAQLKLLLAHCEQAGQVIADVDARILRDFNAIELEQQQKLELNVMRSLMQLGKYHAAATFIYSRLFEDQRYLWWKFDMTIAYAIALAEIGQTADAMRQVQDIKVNLQRVLANKSMTPQQVDLYGAQVASLEVELHRRGAQR